MKKLVRNQAVRYVFFGGCTTVVNFVTYYLLRQMIGLDITAANLIAISLSILFAYVVNKLFVFEHRTHSVRELLKEAGSFIGMRLGTMLTEILGVLLLSCIWGLNDMLAKLILQFVILVLNYLISRFVVFREASDALDEESRRARKLSRVYFLSGFFLSVLIAGIAFIMHGVWPFGDKTVLIVDSLHQYLPFYTDLHQKLTDSESLLYSFSGGLGYNFWSTFAYYMASPVNFLLVLVPMEHVCDFMDLVILLKIGLCGGCFSWYLHKRDPRRIFLPAVFGAMFALSNYVIGYYFNLMWLDSVAMLPLILYGIERIVKGKSGRWFCLALFYGLWCNYYIGFMLCIVSCLYFLVCWISARQITVKRVFKSCVTFGWYALLAGGMASLLLIPAYMGLSSSESMQSNQFPATVKFYTDFMEMMLSHFAFMEPINISSTQVGLNAYCGVAAIPLTLLYLFDSRIRLRERLSHYALTGLLLLSFSLNILNYIWHGFHIQNGLPNRFAFIYIALLLMMAYDALGHIRSFALPKILVSFAAPLAFVAYVFATGYGELEAYIYVITLGILVLWTGLALLGRYGKFLKPAAYYGIVSAVAFVEVASNGISGILENGGVTRSTYVADQTSYQALMGQQNDDSFYRSEVDRQRMRNVTMFVGGNGLVMFNSTMQDSVIDFCDSLGIEARTNKNGYLGVTKLMNDVLGIKYLASPSKLADTMYQFRRLSEDGELTLYKNDNALSLGFMVQDSIKDWDTSSAEPLEVQNSFAELAAGCDPIFVLDRYIDMADGETYGVRVPENKQVYLCIDTRVKEIALNTPEYTRTYTDYTDHLYVINSSATSDLAEFTVTLKDTQTTVRAEVYTCSNEAYQKVIDKLSESEMTDVQVSGNQVSGRIDAAWDGTLLLTVPYDEGWTIRVDGTQTQYDCIGGALIGISLDAGEHTIEMEYTSPGLWEGSICSLLCVILFALSGLVERRFAERLFEKDLPETEDLEKTGKRFWRRRRGPDGNTEPEMARPGDPGAGMASGGPDGENRTAKRGFGEGEEPASGSRAGDQELPPGAQEDEPDDDPDDPWIRQLEQESSEDAWKDTDNGMQG